MSAPGEAMLFEQLITQIILVDLIREGSVSVRIHCCTLRRYPFAAVLVIAHIRIIERIDVDGQPQRVLGERRRSFHRAIVKTGGIIIFHGGEIVSAVFVNQKYFFQLIFVAIQFIKDLRQVLRNVFVTDQLPFCRISFKIIMPYVHIAQIIIADFDRFQQCFRRTIGVIHSGGIRNTCYVSL